MKRVIASIDARRSDKIDELVNLYRYSEIIDDSSAADAIFNRVEGTFNDVSEAIDMLDTKEIESIIKSLKPKLLGPMQSVELSADQLDLLYELLSNYLDHEEGGERYYLAQLTVSAVQ
jgi:hypothetical protein